MPRLRTGWTAAGSRGRRARRPGLRAAVLSLAVVVHLALLFNGLWHHHDGEECADHSGTCAVCTQARESWLPTAPPAVTLVAVKCGVLEPGAPAPVFAAPSRASNTIRGPPKTVA